MLVGLVGAIIERTSSRYAATATVFPAQVTAFGIVGCAGLLIAMALAWKSELISRWMAAEDQTPVTGPELSAEALMPGDFPRRPNVHSDAELFSFNRIEVG
jgi:hypothetical protein